MIHRLIHLLLLVGLVSGPFMAGRMAVDHARADSAPVFGTAFGEICGDSPPGAGNHAHCDYCQIATQSTVPSVYVPVQHTRRRISSGGHPAQRRIAGPGRWHHPPSNAPPSFA